MISGRWFTRPGEAAVPGTFLAATGTRVGDTVVLSDHGKAVPVRIVGEVFHPTNNLMVFADAATFAKPNLSAASYHIAVTRGTDVYQPGALALLGLGGLLIAVVGALLPAGWAARTRTAVALRTE